MKLENVSQGNIIPSAKPCEFGHLSFDPCDFPSNDEDYFTLMSVAETTPWCSDHAAYLLTAAMLHLNSPPEAPKKWGQINTNLNDYHSDPMEISSTL